MPKSSKSSNAPASHTMTPVVPQQLVLVKRDQRWVLKYMPGEESAVLHWLAGEARNPASALDWFDAAVLSHQMGSQLAQQLESLMKTQQQADKPAA